MPAPATVDAFLEIVRKSNQVDSARLDAYLKQRPEGIPTTPRKLAASMIRAGILTIFQAEQFLLGKYRGFYLAGYRILERIGIGGTGTVYLAEHALMKRRVAIKVLPTPMANDPVTRQRFMREAQVAGQLQHPNVVQVLDFREENGLHAIIMEYVHGPNLQQLLNRRGPQPVRQACEYIRQAALGLQHAHEAGLVHRDVKPANLLLDATGVVKLLDLGLARQSTEQGESLTQKFHGKMVMGTADYLPPEQAMSLHDVDHRADIYSLGCTLYALIAGHPPFHEGSIGQKLLWHQTLMPPRLDRIRPEVPRELADLVERMMAKSPVDRPACCAEIADLLERWAGDATQRLDVRPSPGTLAEFDLGGASAAFSCGGLSRLAPPSTPLQDETIGSQASDETGRMKPAPRMPAPEPSTAQDSADQQPTPPRPVVAMNQPAWHWRFLLLAGLLALVAGLLGGVLALLLMGLRG
ncbi:MAG: serine/threonine-protein kinase [Gemmataceae bacterium]